MPCIAMIPFPHVKFLKKGCDFLMWLLEISCQAAGVFTVCISHLVYRFWCLHTCSKALTSGQWFGVVASCCVWRAARLRWHWCPWQSMHMLGLGGEHHPILFLIVFLLLLSIPSQPAEETKWTNLVAQSDSSISSCSTLIPIALLQVKHLCI
jgi:hypothetical protein